MTGHQNTSESSGEARARSVFDPADLLLYHVTDGALSAPRSVPDVVEAAVDGGVTMVQVRGKDLGGAEFLDLVQAVATRVGSRVPVLINDRVDVYLAARERGLAVAGVHVGQSDIPVSDVRAICGPAAIVGLSAAQSTEFDAVRLLPEGTVDYIGIGAVHTTSTKPDHPEPLGIDGFRAARAWCPVPAVAIGGVRVEDCPPLLAAGADGVAVVSGICANSGDPRLAATQYREALGVGSASASGEGTNP
ncbi:thiamine phosphate synthase [Kocuria sp. JC486]|uniref:thiamine phosphate synthase n=1 Tax=Kocuria sp. JC486 TaxID=1970736 RepID=UPI001423D1E5|nr:thiamine phosphate synthase [Kocuria sp. JC486]NHU84202.1 thiamine phosphate synthase [Kocuria sp. JC486]